MFERNEKIWHERYQELKEYKSRFGNCKVPSSWKENPSLAKWVTRQRENEETMAEERKGLLNDIGFLWRGDLRKKKDENWLQYYEQLKAFYLEKKGPCKVPETKEEYRSLSLWESRQRKNKKKLSVSRRRLLDEIGFLWQEDLNRQRKESWMRHYEKLKNYYDEHGHSSVPSHNNNKALDRLGSFVTRLRRREQDLETWQKKLLAKIEFVWSTDIEKNSRKKWLTVFNKLKRYKKEYGHCDVPSKSADHRTLGRWVEVQRKNFSNLEDWKKKSLLDLGFNTSAMLKRNEWQNWLKTYNKLAAFYEKYGHSNVPEKWPEDPDLARFVVNQRWAKNPPKEKIEYLKRLEFNFKGDLENRERKRDERGMFINELE